MKKTYPGQSKKIVAYNICITGVSIVIVGFPTFYSTIDRQVMIYQFTSKHISTLKPQTSAMRTYYKAQEGYLINDAMNFELKLFLKGTINKWPGFSKPGLI
ncbi:MAG TPA: hypothetical protein VKA49_14760 [Flavitalea sp.]|nr:hypothetical protein [Flavitalea sp.]